MLRAGLPVARKIFLPSLDPDERAGQAAWLGGYPLVVKMPNSEGGRGVHLAENEGALTELLRGAPAGVELEASIRHERAFRLLVIGDRVAACSAAAPGADDFRSNSTSARDLGPTTPPEGAVDIACRATAALRLDLGGVDILESLDGRLFVAEVNCPCYFAQQQAATGRDLAGAIVDHLLAKATLTADTGGNT